MIVQLVFLVSFLAFSDAVSWQAVTYPVPKNYTFDSFFFKMPNGKYLRALGRTDKVGLQSEFCEFYDPSDYWKAAPSMPLGGETYMYSAVGAVAGTKALIAGGNFNQKPKLASFYLDQAGTAWKSGPNLIMSASEGTATALGNKVLISGGFHDWNVPHNALQLVDLTSNTTTNTVNMTTARAGHTSVLLQNGKVLIIGGYTQISEVQPGSPIYYVTKTCEIYDPVTTTTSPAQSMSNPRYYHTAILLANGNVLVSGGTDSVGWSLTTAEIYDPTTNTWTNAAPMGLDRYRHAMTLLENGNVLVVAGHATNGTCEIYNPATNVWSNTAYLSPARTLPVVIYVPMYYRSTVVGGSSGSQVVKQAASLYWLNITIQTNATAAVAPGTTISIDAFVYDTLSGAEATHLREDVYMNCPQAGIASMTMYTDSHTNFQVAPTISQTCLVFLNDLVNVSVYLDVIPPTTTTTTTATTTTSTTATTTTATTTTTTTATTTSTTSTPTTSTSTTTTPTTSTSTTTTPTTSTSTTTTPTTSTSTTSTSTTTTPTTSTSTTTTPTTSTSTTTTPTTATSTTSAKSTSTTSTTTTSTSTTNVPGDGTTEVQTSSASTVVVATLLLVLLCLQL